MLNSRASLLQEEMLIKLNYINKLIFNSLFKNPYSKVLYTIYSKIYFWKHSLSTAIVNLLCAKLFWLPNFPPKDEILPNRTLSATASLCGIHVSLCVFGEPCFRCDPLVVVGDLCVNSWFVLAGTALAPAHHPEQEHPTCRFTHQRTTGVTLWEEDATVSQCSQHEERSNYIVYYYKGSYRYGYWLILNLIIIMWLAHYHYQSH